MKHALIPSLCLFACLSLHGGASALDERQAEELSCRPVHGYVQLPGIKYDDLTPLAREVFRSNPASVSNALYALPSAERDDFIELYLEPTARERHRYFFARCREIAAREAVGMTVRDGEVIPIALRNELRQREEARLALHEGALRYQIGSRTVFIPSPTGYVLDDGPLSAYLRDTGAVESLAVFGKLDADGKVPSSRPTLAGVNTVRETSDTIPAMLAAYRTMVDADWRVSAVHPAGAATDLAETVDYKWNLEPFNIREHSFCYGQFEKTSDLHGVNHVKYRATAVIMLPSCFIQVSVVRTANTGLDQVDETNTDLARWRDAIVVANSRYLDGR